MIEVVIAALVIATACFFLAAVLTCLDRSRFRDDDDLRRSTNTMELGTDPWSKQSTKTGNMLFIGIRFSTPSVKVVKLTDRTFSRFTKCTL